MERLRRIVVHVLKHWAEQGSMLESRLAKLLYVADWRSVLETDEGVTGVAWRLQDGAPYSPQLRQVIERTRYLKLIPPITSLGETGPRVSLEDGAPGLEVSVYERRVFGYVGRLLNEISWDEFIGLVYSTYPMVYNNGSVGQMDLLDLKKRYFREVAKIDRAKDREEAETI